MSPNLHKGNCRENQNNKKKGTRANPGCLYAELQVDWYFLSMHLHSSAYRHLNVTPLVLRSSVPGVFESPGISSSEATTFTLYSTMANPRDFPS